MAIRRAPALPIYYRVTFFEWISCNTAGNHRTYISKNQDFAVSDLGTLNPDWNDTIASIEVSLYGGP